MPNGRAKSVDCNSEIVGKTGKNTNPKGINGYSQDKLNLRRLVRVHTEDAINTIVEIMKNSEDEGARLAAAKDILDRGWGRPANQIEIQQTDMHMITAFNREQIIEVLPRALEMLAQHEAIALEEFGPPIKKIAR